MDSKRNQPQHFTSEAHKWVQSWKNMLCIRSKRSQFGSYK